MVDDLKTAQKIIELNNNWPQLQFQFACAYALQEVLHGFDKIRLRVFRKRLTDHPLYDYWNLILEAPRAEEKLFDVDGLSPNQTVSLVFQVSIDEAKMHILFFS